MLILRCDTKFGIIVIIIIIIIIIIMRLVMFIKQIGYVILCYVMLQLRRVENPSIQTHLVLLCCIILCSTIIAFGV